MIRQTHVQGILVICLFTIAISCNEPQNPFAFDGIYGTIRDATTDACLSDAKVYLYESDNEGGWGGGSPYYVIDSMFADANGEYAFEFDNTSGHSYSLFATKEEYIVGNNLTFVQYGNEKDVLLDPEAFISLHIVNVAPSEPWDQIGINGPYADSFNGEDVDTTVVFDVAGNRNHVLVWSLNGETATTDTIYCLAFDTTYYELLY